MTLQQKLVRADCDLDMLKDKAKETDKLAKENLRLRKNFDRALNVIRKDTRKIERLKEEVERKNNIINKAKEYIEYYFVKGKTKNAKQFDLGLYEILTGENLFFLTRKEVEQYFSKEVINSERDRRLYKRFVRN